MMISTIINIYKSWKEKRFFKKHGVENWQQFNRKYDCDFNPVSKTIKGLFHGYHSFYLVETHYVVDLFGPMPSSQHISEWCEENCIGKYRIQEVETWGYDDMKMYSKYPGEIELFVAFKEQDDAINYAMFYEPIQKNKIDLNSVYGYIPGPKKGKFDVV